MLIPPLIPYQKIQDRSISLNLVGKDNLNNGIQTSKNIYIHFIQKFRDNQYYHFTKDGLPWKIEKIDHPTTKL